MTESQGSGHGVSAGIPARSAVPRWWDEAWSVDPVPDCVKHPKPRIPRGIDLADVEAALIGDGIPPGEEGWERCTLLYQLHHLAEYYRSARG